MKRIVSRRWAAAAVVAAALLLSLLAGVAVASNMGFKLNYGILVAINQHLEGSGVSVSQHAGDGGAPALEVNLDLANRNLAPQNSNMGFKLNLVSLPADGLPVATPDGDLSAGFGDDSIVVSGQVPGAWVFSSDGTVIYKSADGTTRIFNPDTLSFE
jgi:hypothetical protein